MKPGDTIMIHQSTAGQLSVCVAKGQGRAQQPAGDMGDATAAAFAGCPGQPRPVRVGGRRNQLSSRSASLDLDDLDTPSMRSYAAVGSLSQRSRRTLYGRRQSPATDSDGEEVDEEADEGGTCWHSCAEYILVQAPHAPGS